MGIVRRGLLSAYGGYAFRTLYLLLLIPLYARTLGPEAYGVVLAAMALQNLVWLVQGWGFAILGARNIAARADDAAACEAEFARQAAARLLLTPLALGVGLVAALASPLLLAHPTTAALAILCGLLCGFNLGWFFQGRLQFAVPVLVEAIGCVITLAMVLLLVHGPADVDRVLVSLVVSTVVATAIVYTWALRQVRLRRPDWRAAWRLVVESTPLFLGSGCATLMTLAGTYALAVLSSADQVATFGTAEKVVVTLIGLLGPIGQVLMPWFSLKLSKSGAVQHSAIAREQFRAVRIVTAIGGVAMLATMTLLPPLLALWLGPRYAAVGPTLQMLSPLLLLGAFNTAVSVYVMVPRRQERLMSAIVVGSALGGLLALGFGAWFDGVRGVVIARIAAEACTSIAFLAVLRRDRHRATAWAVRA